MITLHPTAKAFGSGFIPMITMRNARGHMVGSRCPQGDAREWRSYPDRDSAEIDARLVALRSAANHPEVIRVAEGR